MPMHAYLVESPPVTVVIEPNLRDVSRRSATGSSHGHSFQPRMQCQICGRYGHLAQRCYYRFNRDYGGPPAPPPLLFASVHDGPGWHPELGNSGQHFGSARIDSAQVANGTSWRRWSSQARDSNPFSFAKINTFGFVAIGGPHLYYALYDKPTVAQGMGQRRFGPFSMYGRSPTVQQLGQQQFRLSAGVTKAPEAG